MVPPVFIPDDNSDSDSPMLGYDVLRQALRLSNVASPDGLAIIDRAIIDARVSIYSRIPLITVNSILSKPYTLTPSSTDEILRQTAIGMEIAMVRIGCLRTMPMLFMDGNSAGNVWNDENIARLGSSKQISDEIDRLTNDIENALSGLLTGDPSSSADGVQVFDGTPCNNYPKYVGNSLHIKPLWQG